MNSELIIINKYCSHSQIEPEFISNLEHEGLIEISVVNNERYIHISQLETLERYARLYYDLSVNIEGIDVIRNLLERIDQMQNEISHLKEVISLIDK